MSDLISSIALICQLSVGAGTSNGVMRAEQIIERVEQKQIACQKELAKCFNSNVPHNLECVSKRKALEESE